MISVVLATHNEAKNIKRCLAAVTTLADEIIVVDGESTDDTVQLAKAAGAKVISTTNKANFHINKQLAMDAAKGTLVLQLDADEVVTGELAAFIKEVHRNLKNINEKAWYINRKNYFLGRFLAKGGQYPDPVIRLYVNGYAKLPQKDVHEQMEVSGPIGTAEGELLHYSNPSFDDYVRKFNTYTSFKAQQLLDDSVKVTPLTGLIYCIWKPTQTFFSLFLRHRGYVDGVPGFVFALMSGLYHTVSFLKLWELYQTKASE
jgi:glycosyltransferase involved in cell wall biosynthesis